MLPAHQKKIELVEDGEEAASPSKISQPKVEVVASAGQGGLVQYKGAMVDINSVMQRLDKSEKTRSAVETKLKDIQQEMGMGSSCYNNSGRLEFGFPIPFV